MYPRCVLFVLVPLTPFYLCPSIQSLSQWTELFKKHSAKENRLGGIVEAQHACEDGMRVFSEQLRNLIDPLGLGDLSDDNDSDGDEPMLTIDALVASTTRHCQVSPSSSSPLHTLSEVLYKQNSIKCDPFEWVYEGVYPLTVENVLKRKKATPAAVALAATTVARRTGIPLLPMPAAPIEAGAGHDNRSVGTVPLDVLPLDLQVRMKSASSQSAAPGPGSWLLYYFSAEDTNTKNSTTRGEDMCMDASSGEVMSVLEAKQQFPAAFLPVDSDSDMREEKEREAWRKQSVLKTWQGLCRIAMQGHQRRGESDYVPHWMYVGLALDPLAPEWARALKAPEINVVVDS